MYQGADGACCTTLMHCTPDVGASTTLSNGWARAASSACNVALQSGKGGGGVGHQVDLVHGHKQVAYAHQAAHIQVAAGLGRDAARRIHQQDAGVALRRGRHHVARVLRVDGAIGQHQWLATQRHITPGYVNGYAPGLFVDQAVKRQ